MQGQWNGLIPKEYILLPPRIGTPATTFGTVEVGQQIINSVLNKGSRPGHICTKAGTNKILVNNAIVASGTAGYRDLVLTVDAPIDFSELEVGDYITLPNQYSTTTLLDSNPFQIISKPNDRYMFLDKIIKNTVTQGSITIAQPEYCAIPATISDASALPTNGWVALYTEIYNTNFKVDGFIKWVCWQEGFAAPLWQPSTVYIYGDLVRTTTGKLYFTNLGGVTGTVEPVGDGPQISGEVHYLDKGNAAMFVKTSGVVA